MQTEQLSQGQNTDSRLPIDNMLQDRGHQLFCRRARIFRTENLGVGHLNKNQIIMIIIWSLF